VGCGDQAVMVSKLVEKVGILESTMLESERQRRCLHNELVELRGNIRVFARIRPTDKVPVAEATSSTSMRLLVDAKPNDFQFDRCVIEHPDFASVLHSSPLDSNEVCKLRCNIRPSMCLLLRRHRQPRCDCGWISSPTTSSLTGAASVCFESELHNIGSRSDLVPTSSSCTATCDPLSGYGRPNKVPVEAVSELACIHQRPPP
jgi:hypothetical protein